MKTTYFILISLVLAITLIISACGDKGVPYSEAPELQTRIEVISDDTLQYGPLFFVGDTIWVQVVDANDNPVPGINVQFSQISQRDTGFFVFKGARTTGDDGRAWDLYSTDSVVGVDTLRAIAHGAMDSIADIVLTIVPGSPLISIHSGNGQFNVTAGEYLPKPCSVFVGDKYNNPVANQRIKFEAMYRSVLKTDSTGDFEEPTAYSRSSSDGFAHTDWLLQLNYILAPTMRAILLGPDNISPIDTVIFQEVAVAPPPYTYYENIQPIFEDNCYLCHASFSGYPDFDRTPLNFYWPLFYNNNLVPGDANSPLVQNSSSTHNLNNINVVEEDKVYRWVVVNNAKPGSSGLLNYNDNIKSIIDASCATFGCHSGTPSTGSYNMTEHDSIRGSGSDAIPNAIPGDSSSLLIQKILPTGNMNQYLTQPQADSIVKWIYVDSLRQY